MKPKIYCISPSGRLVHSDAVERGVQFLIKEGFEVLNTDIFDRQSERFAGTDQARADEINGLYDQVLKHGPLIALVTRGGYGLNRIMHLIDWNKLSKAVEQGLQLVGHSDFTALHLGLLAMTGQISYAGPMLNYDFGRETSILPNDYMYQQFTRCVLDHDLAIECAIPQPFIQQTLTISNAVLWGGNLSLVQNLIGTPYFPIDAIQKGILFLEDVNEHPYRIERMLWQLLDCDILGQQQLIWMGAFTDYQLSDLDQGYDLLAGVSRIQQELQDRGFSTRFVMGLPFGHIRDKTTIPVGALVQMTVSPEHFQVVLHNSL